MANTTETTAEAAGEAVAHATEAAGHAPEAVGMPQLDFATFPNQIFWLVISLVIVYLILSRVALPRIGGILADRQSRIASDIAAAERLKEQAVEAEKAYNQALIDARNEAAKIVTAAKAEIQKGLDKAIVKADAEIAARSAESAKHIEEIRAGAVASVSAVAKDTTEALVSALGGKADAKSVTAAVASRMKG
ncbi:MAG: F0F1 ATP synthase subunit B' [Paracoccaceae bacterium]